MHDPVSRLPSPGHLCGRPETPPCENVLQESPGHGRQSQKHSPRHYCKKINLFWTWKHGWVKILFGEYVCQLGWLLILIRLFTYLFHTSFRIIQKLKFKIQFFSRNGNRNRWWAEMDFDFGKTRKKSFINFYSYSDSKIFKIKLRPQPWSHLCL